MRKAFLFCTLIVLVSCNRSSTGFDLFEGCNDKMDTSAYSELSHDLFSIKYPVNWNHDLEMPVGLDISSADFPDTLSRGFMLSVVPYRDFYLKKNPEVNYHTFKVINYKGHNAVFLIRKDLDKRESDNTVYWRAELKIVNKAKTQVYFLVIGKRHSVDQEPEWCEFKGIVESLQIKE